MVEIWRKCWKIRFFSESHKYLTFSSNFIKDTCTSIRKASFTEISSPRTFWFKTQLVAKTFSWLPILASSKILMKSPKILSTSVLLFTWPLNPSPPTSTRSNQTFGPSESCFFKWLMASSPSSVKPKPTLKNKSVTRNSNFKTSKTTNKFSCPSSSKP